MSQQYAMAATSGTGPKGETCGTCSHRRRVRVGFKRHVHKCSLVAPAGRSEASDIRLKWAACLRWGDAPAPQLELISNPQPEQGA